MMLHSCCMERTGKTFRCTDLEKFTCNSKMAATADSENGSLAFTILNVYPNSFFWISSMQPCWHFVVLVTKRTAKFLMLHSFSTQLLWITVRTIGHECSTRPAAVWGSKLCFRQRVMKTNQKNKLNDKQSTLTEVPKLCFTSWRSTDDGNSKADRLWWEKANWSADTIPHPANLWLLRSLYCFNINIYVHNQSIYQLFSQSIV